MSILPPSGRHRAGSVGPKIARPGVPTAAARCETPESLPTKATASRAIAATVGKSRSLRAANATLAKDRLQRRFRRSKNDGNAGALRQCRCERRELLRRPILRGISAAGENHNQVRAVDVRLIQRASGCRQVIRRRFEARIHWRRGRLNRAQVGCRYVRVVIRTEGMKGNVGISRRRQSSAKTWIAPSEEGVDTIEVREESTRILDRPASHRRTRRLARERRLNARARRRSSPPRAARARTATSARSTRPNAAAKSPRAPASST